MEVTAIQNPSFQPAMRIVTAITNGFPAQVTTSFPNQFITGMIVRLYVPSTFGMVQINQQVGEITFVDNSNFTIDIDTTNYDPFVVPPPLLLPSGTYAQLQYSQVVPVGENNAILTAATRNVSNPTAP